MSGLLRITNPLLDILALFLAVAGEPAELHGWAISRATNRSGPTVYGALDRLESAGWITARWEDQQPDQNTPRRRYYRLTPLGATAARELLAERRPEAPRRTPGPAQGPARPARPQTGFAGGAR